jgi:hypothetical protein
MERKAARKEKEQPTKSYHALQETGPRKIKRGHRLATVQQAIL